MEILADRCGLDDMPMRSPSFRPSHNKGPEIVPVPVPLILDRLSSKRSRPTYRADGSSTNTGFRIYQKIRSMISESGKRRQWGGTETPIRVTIFFNYSKKWIQNNLKPLHQILFLYTCTIPRILVPLYFIANHSGWCETLGRRWDDTQLPIWQGCRNERSRDLDEWGWDRYDQGPSFAPDNFQISNIKLHCPSIFGKSAQIKIRCLIVLRLYISLKGES